MSFDAVLPPPLSRAIKEARADAVRVVRQRVDDFLTELDAELPTAATAVKLRTGETALD